MAGQIFPELNGSLGSLATNIESADEVPAAAMVEATQRGLEQLKRQLEEHGTAK